LHGALLYRGCRTTTELRSKARLLKREHVFVMRIPDSAAQVAEVETLLTVRKRRQEPGTPAR